MMQSIDTQLFRFINQGLCNPWLDLLAPIVTIMGTSEFVLVAGLGLLLSREKKIRRLALVLIAGITVTFFTVEIIKGWVARPRPYEVLAGVHLLLKSDKLSFPSGHTAMAFMAATLVAYAFKKWRILLFVLALCVGFSRIYAGVHFPFDVAGGIVIGIGEGWFMLAIARLCKIDI